jgi:protein tyrosine phosphatase
MWIQNIGAADCAHGNHFDCGDNSMLIQISDPDPKENETLKLFVTPWFPTPKHTFKEVHQFQFLDVDGEGKLVDDYGITDAQANDIVNLLKHALDNRMNVVVHCFAGVCRSGAVAEVGVMMGFIDTESFRLPNTRVKTKMLKALGWSYYD